MPTLLGCVGGIKFIGYLASASQLLYGDLEPTTANILVGPVSAPVDNIPVMFAILSMHPDMCQGQWLPAILPGYAASIVSHFLVNADLF
jgi:Na+/H+ antiporter NhaD/arsenite permease-like protein